MKTPTWLLEANETLPNYMYSLQAINNPWHFYPATAGLTDNGQQIQLGYSCLALKTYYMIGLWDELPEIKREKWISFIQSFQADGESVGGQFSKNAFIDPIVINEHKYKDTVKRRAKNKLKIFLDESNLKSFKWVSKINHRQLVISAETKQAIATLKEINETPLYRFIDFPQSSEAIIKFLSKFNWSYPWSAGAHFAALCVYLQTQTLPFQDFSVYQNARQLLETHVEGLVNQEIGGYYSDKIPEFGQLINGAMKVLTGLDWLEIPIHYPERLIDTCLSQFPDSEGCHLVDVVYVLYRCFKETEHRRNDVNQYLTKILGMIQQHYVSDEGGFSYFIGRSQVDYYGVTISNGLPIADLHGTILLVWALSLIQEMLEFNLNWKVIKP